MGVLQVEPASWMSEDLQTFDREAKKFFERECVPHAEKWIKQQQVDRATWLKAGEAGLLCPSTPEEYGAAGGTFGYMNEYPTARVYADSCVQKIYGGTKRNHEAADRDEFVRGATSPLRLPSLLRRQPPPSQAGAESVCPAMPPSLSTPACGGGASRSDAEGGGR